MNGKLIGFLFLILGQSVCQGDSGGGLVISEKLRGEDIYYLRGVVSNGPSKDGSCDNDQVSTFTNIQFFINLIDDVEARHRPNI